jgi:hypothetical protein
MLPMFADRAVETFLCISMGWTAEIGAIFAVVVNDALAVQYIRIPLGFCYKDDLVCRYIYIVCVSV